MRRVMRQRQGFSLIELAVSAAVTFLTVLTVSAAFLNYSQSFYLQAGVRGGQASLRQSHLMVVRNLRMAGYGMEPSLAFGFPANWMRNASNKTYMSNRLVFRMRNPSFNAYAAAVSSSTISLTQPLKETLRQGQIIQAICPGAIAWTYAQLSADAPAGSTDLSLAPATAKFPNLNDFTTSACFNSALGGIYVFKIDVYDYSIRFIEDQPYLFRNHGLGPKTSADSFGEPVAENIESLRVTFFKADGTPFVPIDTVTPVPTYDTPADDPSRFNNNPANIRAVSVAMVARSSTRDMGVAQYASTIGRIPAFSKRESDVYSLSQTKPDPSKITASDLQAINLEDEITKDRLTGQNLAPGFHRIVSEMTVQVRNMRSAEMPVPMYSLLPGACKGGVPADNYNCAGG